MSRFKPGQSGNPSGRPVGVGVSAEIRKAIAAKAPELLQVIIDKALNEQDSAAAMALLNKIVPNLKASNEPIQFNLNDSGDLSEVGTEIFKAIAGDTLPLDSGVQLLSGLGALMKLREFEDLAARLQRIENILENR